MTFYECKFLIKLKVGLQIRNEAKFSAVSFPPLRGLLYGQEEEEEEGEGAREFDREDEAGYGRLRRRAKG